MDRTGAWAVGEAGRPLPGEAAWSPACLPEGTGVCPAPGVREDKRRLGGCPRAPLAWVIAVLNTGLFVLCSRIFSCEFEIVSELKLNSSTGETSHSLTRGMLSCREEGCSHAAQPGRQLGRATDTRTLPDGEPDRPQGASSQVAWGPAPLPALWAHCTLPPGAQAFRTPAGHPVPP